MRLLLVLFSLAALAPGQEAGRRDAVAAECARITATIEKYLGKKFEQPVPVEVVTRKWMTDYARRASRELMSAEQAATTSRLLARLRQVPAGYDVEARMFDMLEEGILGLYDPEKDTYFVSRDVGGPGAPMFTITATHELVHAYRDVDKDYHARMLRLLQEDSDGSFAVRCLVEGDAWLLGEGLGRAHFGTGVEAGAMVRAYARQAKAVSVQMFAMLADPPAGRYPRVVSEAMIGPYAAGVVFAAAVFEKGGIEALEAAYDEPPRSTEQVLHPEKYLAAEPDEPVVFAGGDPAAALGTGWRTTYASSWGEFDARVFFTTAFGSRRTARSIAAGWDGARLWFCENKGGGTPFVGMVSTWDTERDAAEFAHAWAAWAAARDAAPEERAPFVFSSGEARAKYRVETKEGLVAVRVEGRDVLVADGAPAARLERVLAAMASARRAERGPDAGGS